MTIEQVRVTRAQQIAAEYLVEKDAAEGRPVRPWLVLIAEAKPDNGRHPDAKVVVGRE